MSNHVHLAASAKNNDLSDVLRDFKKYTAKQIIKAIEEGKTESMSNISKAVVRLTEYLKNIVIGKIEHRKNYPKDKNIPGESCWRDMQVVF